VLLLDEPLGALDKRLREAMQIELRQLQREVGITFLFVTHDQEEALSMSDRVAVMSEGKVLQIAAPRALYETPNCREVADFIGTMNFFDAKVIGQEGTAVLLDAGPLGKPRIDHPPPRATAGAGVALALRPERIVLGKSGAVSGKIVMATYLGERSHVLVAVGGLTRPIAVTLQNATATAAAIVPGSEVGLSWDPNAFVVLDR
jgi:ABC-type Fe3+/spermidine/putrescine transport system ATPase subunit